MESHPLTSAGSIENSASGHTLNNTEVKYRLHGQDSVTSSGSGSVRTRQPNAGLKGCRHRFGRLPSLVLLLCLLFCLVIIFALTIVLAQRGSCDAAPASTANSSAAAPAPKVYRDLAGRPFPYQQIRLPSGTVAPITYDLFLFPELSRDAPVYSGNVSILCECRAATDVVVIHALQMNITKVLFRPSPAGSGLWESVREFSVSNDLEQVFIRLRKTCRPGVNFSVNVAFESELTKNRLMGFYLSDYTKKDGTKMKLGATNMEPTFARKAFPCFDEPELKATFALRMLRDANHYSLFNMPLIRTVKQPDGLFVDEYERSVIMSTYLVAFMIIPNDYKNISTIDKTSGVKISVFAPSESIEQGRFALKVAAAALPFFEDFFSMKYPLPKLDMIGLPDFRGGAMENWGLVTYRFIALLHDEKQSSVKHRQSVAEIICHEIAHQWFGNIVTMKWWNDLWLNEGFAAFAQYLGADFYDSSWHVMDQFDVYHLESAMYADSLIHSHPIDVKVENPHEIDSIFDEISYFKGSSLVRMLQTILGMKSLKSGLSIYLNRFAYRNAMSSDLWAALSEGYVKTRHVSIAGSPINDLKRVMATWTRQMNYPLVTILLRGDTLIMRQKRFLLFKNASSYWPPKYQSEFDYLWSIPIYLITDKRINSPKTLWLDMKRETEFKLDHTPKWIKANLLRTGYYRINYDTNTWTQLTNNLVANHKFLNASDRLGLISDAFNLAKSGDLDIRIAMNVSTYLVNERQLGPWSVFQQSITYVMQHLSGYETLRLKLKKFVRELIRPFFYGQNAKFNVRRKVTNLSHNDLLLRLQIFKLAVLANEQEVIQYMTDLFEAWRQNRTRIDPNLRVLAFSVGVSRSDSKTWRYMWKLYQDVGRRSAKDLVFAVGVALTASRDVTVLRQLLQSTLNRRLIRRQDSIFILSSMGKKAAGRDLTWLFIRRNWARFYQDFGDSGFQMPLLLRVCANFATEPDYKMVSDFFDRNPLGAGRRAALQTLEQIRCNIQWREDNFKQLEDWLNTRYPGDPEAIGPDTADIIDPDDS